MPESYFIQHYVKEGIFSKEASKLIKLSAEKRESADYLDFFVASKEEAEAQIKREETFEESIELYLKSKEVL